MADVQVSLKRLADKDLELPSYQTGGAAGMDLAAAVNEAVTLGSGEFRLIPCGFSLAIPEGFEAQVRPRSGLASRFGVTVLNAPGTIDADYRGEIQVLLVNLGADPFIVERGARIAQLVLAVTMQADICEVASLDHTRRGSGGFGSTGLGP